jgi:biopolymer transport protein ExbD
MLKPREREQPELNLIPLVDVVLLLLIFFMVTSTFVEQGRIKVSLPQASTVPVSSQLSDPIVVTVTAKGAFSVNERELINNSPETLRAALLKVAGSERKFPVTIRADARATHQSVVTAMDVVGRLGFAQINIATMNEQRSQ